MSFFVQMGDFFINVANSIDFFVFIWYSYYVIYIVLFHIIKIMWLFYLTPQKSELLYLPAADITCFYSVDTSGFYT